MTTICPLVWLRPNTDDLASTDRHRPVCRAVNYGVEHSFSSPQIGRGRHGSLLVTGDNGSARAKGSGEEISELPETWAGVPNSCSHQRRVPGRCRIQTCGWPHSCGPRCSHSQRHSMPVDKYSPQLPAPQSRNALATSGRLLLPNEAETSHAANPTSEDA